jgi:uncharacterized protein YbjT (DUF2867 family)
MTDTTAQTILLTGATGYVGGRLLKILEQKGCRVRCLARTPAYLEQRVDPATEIVQGDVLDRQSLERACRGIDTAFYLIHSMGSSSDFEEQDRIAAGNFAGAAKQGGVKRIIYLGGLADESQPLSPHMRSRHEVGRLLRESGAPVLELRASIVIGSGSLSFEMIRSLTEKIPVMTVPKWVRVMAQPIGIDDLLAYLEESIRVPLASSTIVEIGGADRLSYCDLMKEYADQRGYKRLMIPVPVLTPYLSSLWLGLVTPLYARIGKKLIDSIKHPSIITHPTADTIFSVRPRGAREAIRAALRNEETLFLETRWSDAVSSGGSLHSGYGGVRVGNRLLDVREVKVDAGRDAAFAPIARIGGKNGWYAYNTLWKLRGILDMLAGGVGMRRGRPQQRELRAGDTLDFWRVEAYEKPRLLKLRAEMKLPGRAWLQFEVIPAETGTVIRQTAMFDPYGIWGLLYWYGVYPVHALIFNRMLRNIGLLAERGC